MTHPGEPSNNWTKNGFGEAVPPAKGKGKFSSEESEQVRRAVKEFCDAKNISSDRLCSECEHKAELKGAWMEIAKQLPHRSVQSVYRHGLRILHPFKRGAWTDKEIARLFELVTLHGKKWVKIQNELHRSSDACRDKYREMSEDYQKGRWKELETEQLKTLIREHIKADPNTTMVEIGKMVEAEGIKMPLVAISKAMGNRSRLSCFKKFQKMTGLFSPSDEGKKCIQFEGFTGADGKRKPAKNRAGRPTAPATNTVQSAATESTTSNSTTVRPTEAPHTGSAPATTQQQQQQPVAEQPVSIMPGTDMTMLPPDGIFQEDVAGDEDMFLLSELASSGATRTSDVSWESIRVEGAQERWNGMIVEWQQQEGEEATEDALTELAFYELAQLLLDRKASKMAAETVEAVDLPLV